MAWTAPITWSAGEALKAAQLNTYLRDNLLESAPAKATTPGGYMVATGANAIAERVPDTAYVATSETTTSTTYTALATAGPALTATTGTRALVLISCRLENNTASAQAFMSFAVSGATTQASPDTGSITLDGVSATQNSVLTNWRWVSLNSGSNTFTAQYRVSAGTGTFSERRLSIMPF